MAFVTKSGTQFRLNGTGWHPWGTTFWQPVNRPAGDSYYPTFLNFFRRVHPAMTCSRIVNFLFDVAGTDETNWRSCDYAIKTWGDAGLKVILDLSDFRNSLLADAQNPYTYDWTAFINFVCNRTNYYTGVVYKNDPTIFCYSIAGESNTFDYSGLTQGALTTFFSTVSTLIRAQDTNHLISSGGFNHIPLDGSGPDWEAVWALPNIDFGSVHPYSSPDPQFTEAKLQLMGTYAASINKPWIIEEYGTTHVMRPEYMERLHWRTMKWAIQYGCAGILYWNCGTQGEETPGSYDVNLTYNPQVAQTINSCFVSNGTSKRIMVQ